MRLSAPAGALENSTRPTAAGCHLASSFCGSVAEDMPVQLFVSVTRFIVQYRITKLLESALFYKLPAIRFHILTPFLVGKLVVLPPFRGAIRRF